MLWPGQRQGRVRAGRRAAPAAIDVGLSYRAPVGARGSAWASATRFPHIRTSCRRIPMPLKTWVLLDQSSNQITPMPRRIGPEDVGGAARGYRVEIREHVGGLSTGVWSVVLDNGAWEVEVVPLRGMGIWKARSGSTTVGWDSPVAGPVHPAFVPLAEPSG